MPKFQTSTAVCIRIDDLEDVPTFRERLSQFHEENKIFPGIDTHWLQQHSCHIMSGFYPPTVAEQIVQWLRDNGIEEELSAAGNTKKVTVTVSMANALPDTTVVPDKDMPTFEIEVPQAFIDSLRNRNSSAWYEPEPGYLPVVIHDTSVEKT